MIGLEWEGFRLIDPGTLGDGDDPIDDEHPALTVLGKDVGIEGLGVPQRSTVLTPSPLGGAIPGPSTSGAAVVRVNQMRTTNKAWLLRFLATLAPLNPDDERPLILHDLLWPEPVQFWARPEGGDPAANALAFGLNEFRFQGATWTAADPTIYAAEATHLHASTPASTQTLMFTNEGTTPTQRGRAWTAEITAHGPVVNPYVRIGSHRVTWVGLTIPSGMTLRIDEDRHTWIDALGVDGFRWSGGSADPDWPIHQPGSNAFVFGCSSGQITVDLEARSTWGAG